MKLKYSFSFTFDLFTFSRSVIVKKTSRKEYYDNFYAVYSYIFHDVKQRNISRIRAIISLQTVITVNVQIYF